MNSKLSYEQSTEELVRLKKELDGNKSLDKLFYDHDHMYNDNFSTKKYANA